MGKQFNDNEELVQRFPLAVAAKEQNTESLIAYVTDRAGHDIHYAIDATKVYDELGYKPRESFETGIA